MRALLILLMSGILSALTLEEAIKEAMRNNPELVKIEAEQDASMARIVQSRSSFFPSLSFGFAYRRVSSVPTFPGGFTFGFPDYYTANLELEYPIFTWGRRGLSLRISKLDLENTRVMESTKKLELRHRVVQAFYQVLLAEKALDLSKEAVERAKDHLSSVMAQYRAGRTTNLDTLRARVALSKARVGVLKVSRQVEIAKEGLNLLLGRFPQEEVSVEGALEFEPVKISLEKSIELAKTKRPELRSLELGERSISLLKRVTRASLRPALGLMVNYQFEKPFQYFEKRWGRLLSAGVSVSFPLFDGFSTKGKLLELEARGRALSTERKALLDMIAYQVSQAYSRLLESQEVLQVQKEALIQAREALRVAKEQYDAGFLSELEYQDAEFAFREAQFELLSTTYNAIVAKSALQKAIGVERLKDLEVEE